MTDKACTDLDKIDAMTRTSDLQWLRDKLGSSDNGLIHVHGPSGIGKRTLMKCLARSLTKSPAARVFQIDLTLDKIIIEEWKETECTWTTSRSDSHGSSLVDLLNALFPDTVKDTTTAILAQESSGSKGKSELPGVSGSAEASIATPTKARSEGELVSSRVEGTEARPIASETVLTPDSSSPQDTGGGAECGEGSLPSTGEAAASPGQSEETREPMALLILKDYEDESFTSRNLGAAERTILLSIIRSNRAKIILLTEEDLISRRFNTTQRLEGYRLLFSEAKGQDYTIGLFEEKAYAESAIKILLNGKPEIQHQPGDSLVASILKVAGPYPFEIELAIRNMPSDFEKDIPEFERALTRAILNKQRTSYEEIWLKLRDWDRAILMTYALKTREGGDLSQARSNMEKHMETYRLTSEDFDEAERHRNVPYRALGQFLLPWDSRGDLYSEAFAEFVYSQIPGGLAEPNLHVRLMRAKSAPFMLLLFMLSLLLTASVLAVILLIPQTPGAVVLLPFLPIVVLAGFYTWSSWHQRKSRSR